MISRTQGSGVLFVSSTFGITLANLLYHLSLYSLATTWPMTGFKTVSIAP